MVETTQEEMGPSDISDRSTTQLTSREADISIQCTPPQNENVDIGSTRTEQVRLFGTRKPRNGGSSRRKKGKSQIFTGTTVKATIEKEVSTKRSKKNQVKKKVYVSICRNRAYQG